MLDNPVVVDADGGGSALERHVDAVVPGAVAALAHNKRPVLAAVQQLACLARGCGPDEAALCVAGTRGPAALLALACTCMHSASNEASTLTGLGAVCAAVWRGRAVGALESDWTLHVSM
jgi:hypothetical protein